MHYDLKPGIKFLLQDRICFVVSVCKSRDRYSVDISYKYYLDGKKKYDSIVIDKEEVLQRIQFLD